MMRSSGLHLGLFTFAFALLVSIDAQAGLLYPGGNPHPNAVPGWSGTVPLIHDPGGADQYYGDIEYAVFTDADFAIAFPGQDTPNGGVAGGEVIYAYQVYNAGTRGDITQFSAGLADLGPPLNPAQVGDGGDDPELVNAGDEDFVAGTGQDPNLMTVISGALYGASSGSAVRWNFLGAVPERLNSGEWSSVLFYTSPWGPAWDNGSTTSGTGQSRIPAPEEGVLNPNIPEPATVALALFALAALSMRRPCK